MNRERWFNNFGGFGATHSLETLRDGVAEGLIDFQNEYGSTALSLAVGSGWYAGVEELLGHRADTELRYFRTGATALYEAVLAKDRRMVALLIVGGANPDAANYWGVTPRRWMPDAFEGVPLRDPDLPGPHIQNAEHLADHHHPRFQIPDFEERVTLQPGQAVGLYVYGPKSPSKQDQVKVRITTRRGQGTATWYTAKVETPVQQTHLIPETTQVEFGPENVATVYVPR